MIQSKTSGTKPRRSTIPASPKRQPLSKEPYLRFHLSVALRKKTVAVLDQLEASSDPTEHRKALANIVVDLTRCGMDEFFMKPLKLAKAGFITEQSAALGMEGAVQVISSVIRNIIGGMGTPQLRSVCGSVGQFMQ